MRLERLASPGAPRTSLLVAPALLLAASVGGLVLRHPPRPIERNHAISVRKDLARAPGGSPAGTAAVADSGTVAEPAVDSPRLSRAASTSRATSPPDAFGAEPDLTTALPPPPKPALLPVPVVAPVPPPPPPPGPVEDVWRSMALCESGGNWHTDSGNGYYGGLQFSLPSWQAVGGQGLPHEHPRDLQIEMAERLVASQGWEAWPNCARRLGLV